MTIVAGPHLCTTIVQSMTTDQSSAVSVVDAISDIETKDLSLKISDEAKGEVTAVVATFDVIDKVGDVTSKGFFGRQNTAILVAHDKSKLPVGKGVVYDGDSEGLFEGQFNMGTEAGREAFKAVEFMGELQQWSYGYRVTPTGSSRGTKDGSPVRLLHKSADGGPGAHVFEVSPLVLAAGEGTRTIQTKSFSAGRFVDQASETVETVRQTIERAQQIKELRADDGRDLGAESRDMLMSLVPAIDELKALLSALTVDAPEQDDYDEAAAALVQQAAEAALSAAQSIHS